MTAMSTEVLGLPHGRPLTRADLDLMPEDGHRYELIDGTLIVSPSPLFRHQLAHIRLVELLLPAVPDDCQLLSAPFDVVLADDTVIQPDLLIAPKTDFTERDLPTAPLLAIEILSPSTRGIDLLLKKERLQRAGCAHYWVVDPEAPSITAWTLAGGEYGSAIVASDAELFEVEEPLTLALAPRQLIAG